MTRKVKEMCAQLSLEDKKRLLHCDYCLKVHGSDPKLYHYDLIFYTSDSQIRWTEFGKEVAAEIARER